MRAIEIGKEVSLKVIWLKSLCSKSHLDTQPSFQITLFGWPNQPKTSLVKKGYLKWKKKYFLGFFFWKRENVVPQIYRVSSITYNCFCEQVYLKSSSRRLRIYKLNKYTYWVWRSKSSFGYTTQIFVRKWLYDDALTVSPGIWRT